MGRMFWKLTCSNTQALHRKTEDEVAGNSVRVSIAENSHRKFSGYVRATPDPISNVLLTKKRRDK